MYNVKYSPVELQYKQRVNFNKNKFIIYGKRTLKLPNKKKLKNKNN